MIFAKTSPEKGAKGITSFIVDMSLPGVSVGKHEEKMGLRGVATSDVVLEDVRVPKSEILGEDRQGLHHGDENAEHGPHRRRLPGHRRVSGRDGRWLLSI